MAWGIGVGAGVFVLTYVAQIFLGPSSYIESPLHAIGFGLGGFCTALFVALLLQVRRVLTLPTVHQVIHIVLVVVLGLVPVRAAVRPLGGFLLETLRYGTTTPASACGSRPL